MDLMNTEIKDAAKGQQRPKLSSENRMVSSYLEDRSEIYRDLMKVKNDGWKDPQATAYYVRQRLLYNKMRKIGDEMDTASGGALSLPRSNARVLDLCMAPGGYTTAVLKHSLHAVVCAYTLPRDLGGHQILHGRDSRVSVTFGDITMLHTEFGVEDIPHNTCESSPFSDSRPWLGKRFDLIFCDGEVVRADEPYITDYRMQVEAVRLTVSQLVLAMQRIESGGTLIVLLHNPMTYETIKILRLFDDIAQVQLFKSASFHTKKGSFYLIAKNVQPGHPKAVAAVDEWKRVWKDLTFPAPDQDGQAKPPKAANESESAEEVSELLDSFGERLIELGEPIWQIQKGALASARRTNNLMKKESGPRQRGPDGASPTTAVSAAAVPVRDLRQKVEDTEGPTEVESAFMLGEASQLLKPDDPGDRAEVDTEGPVEVDPAFVRGESGNVEGG